jgi:hypothetical protein
MYFIAKNIAPRRAPGKLFHEGWHRFLKTLKLSGNPRYKALMKRFGLLIRQHGDDASWFRSASEHLKALGLVTDGDIDSGRVSAKALDEFAAYNDRGV